MPTPATQELSRKFFHAEPTNGTLPSLPHQVDQLLAEQKRAWPRLADGYVALAAARTKVVDCKGFSVTLQFNPQRIVSTGARTDAQSIKARKCFLCVENLPPEQKGILYKDSFLILCNPAPIFDRHLTISHLDHREQVIETFIDEFLDLARDLSPSYTVFYNGPKSGASAPDHMHFQALPVNELPVERDARSSGRRTLRVKRQEVSVWSLNDYGRQVFLLESNNKQAIGETLRRLLNATSTVLNVVGEPLVNILCSYDRGMWVVTVFPRTSHRPKEFFLEGSEKILISPAAVDIGGFIVTPLEHDFQRVDAAMVEHIFRQVSPDAATGDRIVGAL